jgi:berberine-like enzyme
MGDWSPRTPPTSPTFSGRFGAAAANFGAVTSMRIRLHRVHQVLAGFILYPWRQATDALTGLSEVLAGGPDELTVQVGIMSGPDGGPALLLSPTWSGDDLAEGTKAIERLQRLGMPVVSQVAPMAPADMLRLFDAYVVDGRHYAIGTRTVAAYTPDVIAALVNAGATRTSPLTSIYVHHFHGAAAAVPADSTAFGIRRNHIAVEIVAGWEPDDPDDAQHRAWADSVAATLAPLSLPGGYPNLLGPDDHDQIACAYGQNAKRLRAVKERFDPEGIFSATPLTPDPNA